MILNQEMKNSKWNPQGDQITKMIYYSFSKDGKNLSVWTKTHFILWNTSNGKIQRILQKESPMKAIRNDLNISIKDNLEVIVYSNLIQKFLIFFYQM